MGPMEVLMSYIVIDIEADGPIPGDYSMVSLGAVAVEENLNKTFYATLHPISDSYAPEALKISGFTRDQTLKFDDPCHVMVQFRDWIKKSSTGTPRFISDNNGFDWMFVCWYFYHFLGENPFGYDSDNLKSLYRGLTKDMAQNFNHLRKTEHSHNALDDAMGNAEVLLHIGVKNRLDIGL